MTDDLVALLKEYFEYAMTNVHTSFPGVVESYDPKTRRASIQPSLKRRLPDGSFMAFPVLANVPVIYPGSKKYTIHFPLEKGDEVEVRIGERSTGVWRGKGGKDVEDKDPRRFDLNDCYCTPGLQPLEFIAVEEDGLNIVHKAGDNLVSTLSMDDERVSVKYKEKAEVLIEDDRIEVKTSQAVIRANGAKISFGNGTKSLFTILDTLLQTLQTTTPATVGSPAAHNWNPAISQAIIAAKTDIGLLLEE